MKTITKIKQFSTEIEFEITHCTFFTDLVHYNNPVYPFSHFIPNGDWKFVEEDLTVNMTYEEFQKLENYKAKLRNKIVEQAYVLYRYQDTQRENYICQECKRLNL